MEKEKLSDIAKRRVLNKFPDAKCEKDYSMYYISVTRDRHTKDIGAGFSEDGAWCSAGCNPLVE